MRIKKLWGAVPVKGALVMAVIAAIWIVAIPASANTAKLPSPYPYPQTKSECNLDYPAGSKGRAACIKHLKTLGSSCKDPLVVTSVGYAVGAIKYIKVVLNVVPDSDSQGATFTWTWSQKPSSAKRIVFCNPTSLRAAPTNPNSGAPDESKATVTHPQTGPHGGITSIHLENDQHLAVSLIVRARFAS